MKIKKIIALILSTLLIATLVVACAKKEEPTTPAQHEEKKVDYPTKGITILCPTAAGGSLDITVRTLAPELEKILGKNITIVNRSGGAAIGVAEVAETAKPDGYTILVIDKGLISNYETGVFKYGWRDFEPVASLNKGTMYLVVNAKEPYETIKDFIEAAKAAPDELTIGTSGSSGISFLNAFGFASISGAPVKIVPFSGGAETKAAIAGGHVTAATLDGAEIMPLVEAGTLRALACSAYKRSPRLPEVPTFEEQGIDFALEQSKAMLVPKGTPKQIVDILTKAIQDAVNSDDFQKLCTDTMQTLDYMNSEELTAYYEDQESIIKKLIEDAGLAKK